jgi:hypothetical protein
MKNAQPIKISLRPNRFYEKNTELEMIIDKILGPGLTVIGCELASYRHAFMRQMAMAIVTGDRLFDTFTVKRYRVLYNAGGLSEYMIFKNLMGPPTNTLDLRKEWQRFDKDCMGQLNNYLETHHGLGAVFLGEYNLIKRRLPNNTDNLLAAQDLTREWEYEGIKTIRDWSIANKVSVIVCHKLSTRGSLSYGGAITNRDNELKITKRSGQWWLEVAEGSNYLEFGEWELVYDDYKKSFSIKDREKDEDRKTIPRINENDELILGMVRSSQHFPTYQEIEEATGLAHSTAHGRLRSLEKSDGVVKIKDKPIRWMINPNHSGLSMSNWVDK